MIAQFFAIVIFVLMFLMIVADKVERHITTLTSAVLVLTVVFGICMHNLDAVIETLNIHSIFNSGFWYGQGGEGCSGVNWSTIIFIAGMMIMVEGMGKAGFFRWLCLSLAKAVNYHVVPIFICFMCMSSALSMFIDSITVILFLAAVTIELSRILKFDPVSMIIPEIFCANIGGAATMCGDPPNIIIGTSLHLAFFDFLSNTGVVSGICLIFAMVYFTFCFGKSLKKTEDMRENDIEYPSPSDAVKNKAYFISSLFVFAIAVVLLITHAQTTLTVASIGVISAILMLVVTMITSEINNIPYILSKVDYKTLLFFIGLFISVGGLEQTGVLEIIAHFIGYVSGGNTSIILAIVLWISAVASAFVDNIPFAATMIPVIKTMSSAQGVDINVLAWSLSLGTDFGGNATPIGASANVVGTSVAAKEGHPISWGRYCRYCMPATAMVIFISMVCLFVRYL